MKHSTSLTTAGACLAALLAAPRAYAAGQEPAFQWDPETELPCIMWEDIGSGDDEMTCEETRDYWNATPEQFSRWNPSVGLDCKPWNKPQSYCVVPESRLTEEPIPMPTFPSTTDEPPAPTTTTVEESSTVAPSPASWTARGCYFDEYDTLVLEEHLSTDEELTIGKCQDSCYRAGYELVGVEAGNECWCSSFIGGEWAKSQSECDMPCSGNEDETCGGEGRLNIFAPVEVDEEEDAGQSSETGEDEEPAEPENEPEDEPEDEQTDEQDDGSDEAATSTGVLEAEPSSGASRYGILFF